MCSSPKTPSLIASLAVVLLLAGLAAAAPARVSAAPPPAAAAGKVFLTVQEALELAFGDCEVTRGTVYLTKAQLKRARGLAKVDVPSGIVHPYTARRDGKLVATAYFDTHRVRTHRETVMVVVDGAGRIRRLELLSFAEPQDYIPRGNWYGQFLGKELNDDLNLKRDIRGVTGATLTARATTTAVRRVLALHTVLTKKPDPPTGRAVK